MYAIETLMLLTHRCTQEVNSIANDFRAFYIIYSKLMAGTCHYGMVRPRVAAGGDGLQI